MALIKNHLISVPLETFLPSGMKNHLGWFLKNTLPKCFPFQPGPIGSVPSIIFFILFERKWCSFRFMDVTTCYSITCIVLHIHTFHTWKMLGQGLCNQVSIPNYCISDYLGQIPSASIGPNRWTSQTILLFGKILETLCTFVPSCPSPPLINAYL